MTIGDSSFVVFVRREETIGFVIASYAESGDQLERAIELFGSTKDGNFGVPPGPACFGGLVLAHAQAGAWGDVVSTFSEMKSADIQPLPTSSDYLVKAAEDMGGREQVLEVVEELIMSGTSLTMEGYVRATKALIPDVFDEDSEAATLSDLRNKLRDSITAHQHQDDQEEDHELKERKLNLVKALRQAEIEEMREASQHISELQVDERRKEAWKRVLTQLVDHCRR